jgi:hypothetical protein
MDFQTEFEMRRAQQMHHFAAEQVAGKYLNDSDSRKRSCGSSAQSIFEEG